jgi:transposase
MTDAEISKEAMIIRLHGTGMSYRAVCAQLRVGLHRVVSAIRNHRSTGIIPDPLPRDPRKKLTKAIFDCIDIRSLQKATLSSPQLAADIAARFHVHLHPTTIAQKRKRMGFYYQPPRHTQELKEAHIGPPLRLPISCWQTPAGCL